MDKKKIIDNASWIIGCKLVKAVLTLLVTILTARYLGASNYGLINYAASLVTFMTPVMKLGLDAILVHELINDADHQGEILGTSIVLNTLSALLCIIGVVTFSMVTNAGETETHIVCFLYSLLLFFQAVEMVQYWFQAKLLSKYTASSMLISYGSITVFQICLLMRKANIYWFSVSHSLEYMILAGMLISIFKKKTNLQLRFSLNAAHRMLHKSKYYILSGLMVTIFSQTDKVMIKMMMDNASVGYYSAAATCASMTSFVFVAIIDSMRPVIFKSKQENETQFKNNISYLYTIIFYFSLLQCLVITAFSSVIIGVMYGSEYNTSSNVLRVIVWFTTFSYIGTIRDIWILSEGKQSFLWKINFLGAFANVILNYWMIPRMGIMGAALASLITQIFTNIVVGELISAVRPNNRLLYRGINPKALVVIAQKLRKR